MQRRFRPIVVHFGNVGTPGPSQAEKTIRYARRFPSVHFIGVDPAVLDRSRAFGRRPKNWSQWRTDFLSGLNRLRDSSVSVMSSEMALGYYAPPLRKGALNDRATRDHTTAVLWVVFAKLRPGGKLFLVSDGLIRDWILDQLKDTPFRPEDVRWRALSDRECQRTPFLRANADFEHVSYPYLFQLTLQKPK